MALKPFCILLVACFIIPATFAIPSLKCKGNSGLVDPKGEPYGTAKPGECRKCATKYCESCAFYYKDCAGCSAGRGLDAKKTKCLKCAGQDCGYCQDNYTKCLAKVADCPDTPVTKVATAAVKQKWEQKGDFYYCSAKPGFGGTGYSSVFNAAVQNGVCIDCNGPDFRPLTDGKIEFCSFDAVGRQVAANAFTATAGCDYPGSITYKLDRFCVSQKSNLPYYVYLVYKATYCGQTKLVAAIGGGRYSPTAAINAVSEWNYAVKP